MNDPKSEDVSSMGPIPAGQYLIGAMEFNSQMRNHFKLYSNATDWQYHGDRTALDKLLGREAPGRHNFNFHAGRVSEGCVTVYSTVDRGKPDYPDSPDWEKILALVGRSGATHDGYDYINGHLIPGRSGSGRHITGTYSGVLIVK